PASLLGLLLAEHRGAKRVIARGELDIVGGRRLGHWRSCYGRDWKQLLAEHFRCERGFSILKKRRIAAPCPILVRHAADLLPCDEYDGRGGSLSQQFSCCNRPALFSFAGNQSQGLGQENLLKILLPILMGCASFAEWQIGF